jgi:acyl-coenzyme A thioesterase PaaI-like protein
MADPRTATTRRRSPARAEASPKRRAGGARPRPAAGKRPGPAAGARPASGRRALLKETALVRLLGLKIPVLLFLAPQVLEVDEEGAAILVKLGYRSRNHVGSMYFGALAAGADLAGGMNAFALIQRRFPRMVILFKDARMEFLKRADGDVVFRTRDGRKVAAAMEEAARTGERVTIPVEVVATVPDRYGDEPVARFTLGLSMKQKA